jgi:hypothetical protein
VGSSWGRLEKQASRQTASILLTARYLHGSRYMPEWVAGSRLVEWNHQNQEIAHFSGLNGQRRTAAEAAFRHPQGPVAGVRTKPFQSFVKSLSLVALLVRLALHSSVRGKRISIGAMTCTKFQMLRGGMKIMASLENRIGAMKKTTVAATLAFACLAAAAGAQGSRKDDIVFGPSGHPIAGATVRICQPTATGIPCMPLATIYTDATLTVSAPNPFQADGIGNYHFYAPAGRYTIQITGAQITGAMTYPDVILPADVSSSGSGNNISAFGLALGGNLTVAGSATVNGTLSSTKV